MIEIQEDHDRRYLVNVFPFEDHSLLKIQIDWACGPTGKMALNMVRVSGSSRDLVKAVELLIHPPAEPGLRAMADALIRAADIIEKGKDVPEPSTDFDLGKNRGRQEAISIIKTSLERHAHDARRTMGTSQGDISHALVAALTQLRHQVAGR